MTDSILILDFGSQVTQLIARRVRESGVYCEIFPYNTEISRLEDFNANGIILSGGPASVLYDDTPRAPEFVFNSGLPLLGICYGQQTMCAQLGGRVESSAHRECGRAEVKIIEDCEIFSSAWNVGSTEQVWMSHGDRVIELPEGFKVFAFSEGAPFAVIGNETRKYYGTMFHPEVIQTTHGKELLSSFVLEVCGCLGNWTMAGFRNQSIDSIRKQVGESKVICGLSGGVDSSVTAKLIHEAIGHQLTCVFVDHGLLREGEAEEVVNLFNSHYNIPLIHVDASKLFLDSLKDISDPEIKRRTIGALFVEVFEKEAKQLKDVDFLAQGTLYPDVIESVSFTGGPSVTIKSHHNVGGLPERMNLELLEPLRELFKDEVRILGRELGLPEVLVDRHPFPGPGLAIRMPGEVNLEKVKILRAADKIYIEEIRNSGLYNEIWQAFAVLLPVRTVGVMGDARTYDNVCALRAVTSTDGMTADYYPFAHDFLAKVSTRIINEVQGINRVTYDITSKPPGTIEWE